jgi:WD40 repeat protein
VCSSDLRPGDAIQHLAFSPDGKRLACWCGGHGTSNAMAIYESATGKELHWMPALDMRAHAFTWLRDGRGLALVQLDPNEHKYLMWDFTDPKAPLPKRHGNLAGNTSHDHSCFGVSPDGKWVATSGRPSGEAEQPVRLRAWKTGKLLDGIPASHTIDLAGRTCRGLHFSPDNKSLAACCPDEVKKFTEVILIDIAEGKQRGRFSVPWLMDAWGNDSRVALGPRPQQMAMAPAEALARLVDAASGKEKALLPFPKKKAGRKWTSLNTLAFSPSGAYLACAEYDGPLYFWDLNAEKMIWEIPAEPVDVIAFSADGQLMATGSGHGAIRIRETATGMELCPLEAMGYSPRGLAVLANNRGAVSLSAEPALRLWTLPTASACAANT